MDTLRRMLYGTIGRIAETPRSAGRVNLSGCGSGRVPEPKGMEVGV
jgi:hypothetical protein